MDGFDYVADADNKTHEIQIMTLQCMYRPIHIDNLMTLGRTGHRKLSLSL